MMDSVPVGEQDKQADDERDDEKQELLPIVGANLDKTVEYIFTLTVRHRKNAEYTHRNKRNV